MGGLQVDEAANLAVFRYIDGPLTLVELMPGASLEEVRGKTDPDFREML